jgi:transcriptional regulator with XRE-family HTH domain
VDPATDRSRRTVGECLRALRRSRRLGIGQAAREAGIHRATLYRWEQGETQPRLAELEGLLRALRASAEQRHHALALMDVPRARAQVQSEIAQVAAGAGIGPMPDGGALLQAMRWRHGLSREFVASRLGVTTRTLRRWEDGEVWPPPERLHALCSTLHAHQAEFVALTTGAFAPRPGGWESPAAVSQADLMDRFYSFLGAPTLSAEEEILRDLRFLMYEVQAWSMAARRDSARGLLAEVYAHHGQYLTVWGRFAEAADRADRVMEMGPAQVARSTLARAALVGAYGAVFREERPMAKRGLSRLRSWMATDLPPEFRAWLLSDTARYLSLEGHEESALDNAAAASRAAVGADPIELALRRLDEARLLVGYGHAGPALAALSDPPDQVTFPRIYVHYGLTQVEALLLAGDADDAQRFLSDLTGEIAAVDPRLAHHWSEHRAQAQTLTQRLHAATVPPQGRSRIATAPLLGEIGGKLMQTGLPHCLSESV